MDGLIERLRAEVDASPVFAMPISLVAYEAGALLALIDALTRERDEARELLTTYLRQNKFSQDAADAEIARKDAALIDIDANAEARSRAFGPGWALHFTREIARAAAAGVARHETPGPYEARHCAGIPADVCDYGVVSLSAGREVCRVWREQDARAIAVALTQSGAGEPVVKALLEAALIPPGLYATSTAFARGRASLAAEVLSALSHFEPAQETTR